MFKKFLDWLKSFFSSREEGRFDIYKPSDRWIYSYWDGKSTRKVDPMLLYKKVMTQWADISIEDTVSRSRSKDNFAYHDKLINRLRTIYEVTTPLIDGGLTDLEVLELHTHFLTFVGFVKKNMKESSTPATDPSPNTPPSSAPESSEAKSDPDTKPSSGSGSTEGGGSIDKPMPPTSEQG